MTNHLGALAVALALLALLAVSCAGWGKAAAKLLRVETTAERRVWLGWAAMLLVLQLLHLVFPLTAAVVLPVVAAGLVYGLRPRRPPLALIALAIAACWVLSRAMLTPENFDSGLYHFNAIRWIESAPIVPGLANLHGRLGFSQPFFVYAAALDFHPLYGHGRGLANAFLLLLLGATAWSAAFRDKQWAGAFVLPVACYLALESNGLASPSPDLASTILQLAMFLELAHLLGEASPDGTLLAVLAATAVALKLSNAGFAAAMIGIAAAYAWKRAVLPAAAILVVAMLRNVVVTGAPLYPSAIGWIPAEWSVPRWQIINEANWVASWAREPGRDWHLVLGNHQWLGTWSRAMMGAKIEVMAPLVIAAAFAVAALCMPVRNRWKSAILIVAPAASLIFWFFTAPDIRFAHASFLLLPVACALLLLARLPRVTVPIAAAVFLAANVHTGYYALLHRGVIARVSMRGWQPVPVAMLSTRTTHSGLPVFVPVGGQCWDSPLPCTPNFDPQLERRGGFRRDR